MKYDLRTEPWITCEWNNGTIRDVGFVELFEKAHEIRRFQHDNPLAEAALMRILIALSHRILKGPTDKKSWKEAFERGYYDREAVGEYFDKWHDRFDLFDEKYPFMQASGLRMTEKDGRPLNEKELPTPSLLLHHIATGNNATLFSHMLDTNPAGYQPKEAAYVVLIGDFFSLGGTHKKSTDLCGYQGNCKNGTLVNGLQAYIFGETLFETLMFNTLVFSSGGPLPSGGEDAPFWEFPECSCTETMPKGYLDFLTFTSRLIRLEEPEEDGKIYRLHFACGRSLKESVPDPFTPTKLIKNEEKPLDASLERALWRDSDTLFRFDEDRFHFVPLRQLSSLGRKFKKSSYNLVIYTLINKKANPKGYLKESFPIAEEILEKPQLRNAIKESVSVAEKGSKALENGLKHFSDESGIETDVIRPISSEIYWGALELPFKIFLAHIAEEDAYDNWQKVVQNAVIEAYRRVTKPLVGEKSRSLKAYIEGEKRLYIKQGGKK